MQMVIYLFGNTNNILLRKGTIQLYNFVELCLIDNPYALKDAGDIKKSIKAWLGENNGNWRHISPGTLQQPASALKQAGIGDSQQSTRGTPRIIGAATQKEDFVSGAKLLPYIPS